MPPARPSWTTCTKNGLKAIVTVDQDGGANTNELKRIVTGYRNHPAILAWAIGNEWNINFFKGAVTNENVGVRMQVAAEAAEKMARMVKALDTNHSVCSILGDIDIPGHNPLFIKDEGEGTNKLVSTERIVNLLAPSVDFWGLNIYRGASFFSVSTNGGTLPSPPTPANRCYSPSLAPY